MSDKATDSQMEQIASLSKQARIGTYANIGIKAVLPNPPKDGISQAEAAYVIEELQKRIKKFPCR